MEHVHLSLPIYARKSDLPIELRNKRDLCHRQYYILEPENPRAFYWPVNKRMRHFHQQGDKYWDAETLFKVDHSEKWTVGWGGEDDVEFVPFVWQKRIYRPLAVEHVEPEISIWHCRQIVPVYSVDQRRPIKPCPATEDGTVQWKMPFGRHKGRLLSEVPIQYLRWLQSIDLSWMTDSVIFRQQIDETVAELLDIDYICERLFNG